MKNSECGWLKYKFSEESDWTQVGSSYKWYTREQRYALKIKETVWLLCHVW